MAGHEVVAMSRGHRARTWSTGLDEVERVQVDREAEDAAGTFAPG